MSPSTVDRLVIPAPFDAHVHLRQGALMQLVVPHVKQGGVSLALVMPNLIPPLTIPDHAAQYLAQLENIAPDVKFLPTLYLSPALTPQLIREAKAKGVVGVKSYPRGVTTNSDGGVGMEGYAVFDEVFGEMEKQDMILNLHGEVPSDVDGDGCCVLDAEIRFLPHLREIHSKFPKLRIVLEHCTTAAAVECVKSLPSTVSATITPHHLFLTIDHAISSSLNFCKPIAKYPSDRAALRKVIAEGHPQFFLGSDSAPHPSGSKLPKLDVKLAAGDSDLLNAEVTLPSPCAAGIYTSADLVPLTATIFESSGIPLERLADFVSGFGRKFYGYPAGEGEEIVLKRVGDGKEVTKAFPFEKDGGGVEWIVPFLAGQKLGWEIERK
ncbi:dihydroorotase [Meredithblackwellia eburnea MCA 4105]